MSEIEVAAGSADGERSAASAMRPFDVRLKREIAHRRMTISVARRVLRVLSLHLVDGVVTAAVAAALGAATVAFDPLREYTLAVIAIVLLSLNALSAYDPGDGRRDYRRLASGVALSLLILTCLIVFPPHLPLPLRAILGFGACEVVALALGRKGVDLLVRQVYVRGIGLRRAVLIGDLDDVGRAIVQLRDEQNLDQYLIGHLAPVGENDPTALGTVQDLARVMDQADVEEVIVATSLPAHVLREVTESCFDRGVTLFVVPAVMGSTECRIEPVWVGRCPLLHLFPSRIDAPSLLAKRAFDLLAAAVVLVLLLPLIALIALAVRLDSAGPVFYRQRRVGLRGRHFTMLKFRSMCADADSVRDRLRHLNAYNDHRLFKLRDDPRITRVGRWLRRTSLDELPQLLNVLRGEMSLVGPRPPLPTEVAEYEPHHLVRLAVMPGITGPWQVNGRNLITDFEEVVRMERAYIHSWSLMADLKILLRTLPVVISGQGAY
ncbi:MAG TPA: sugar transferase [Longimicrobiaceae bacterium]|nr:sugar transferase [Longimicrobiaceae bacterium]